MLGSAEHHLHSQHSYRRRGQPSSKGVAASHPLIKREMGSIFVLSVREAILQQPAQGHPASGTAVHHEHIHRAKIAREAFPQRKGSCAAKESRPAKGKLSSKGNAVQQRNAVQQAVQQRKAVQQGPLSNGYIAPAKDVQNIVKR